MTPEAKFSWLMAAVAVVLFGLILLSLGRIVPRGQTGAIVATHKGSN
jgi:hypothetical protein